MDNIKGQLSEEDVPLYQGPVTEGIIPVHIPPTFLEEIDQLGTVGGGTCAIIIGPCVHVSACRTRLALHVPRLYCPAFSAHTYEKKLGNIAWERG